MHPAHAERMTDPTTIDRQGLIGLRELFTALTHHDRPLVGLMITHDQTNHAHSLRVGGYAGILARALGENQRLAQLTGLFHDIGKICVPAEVWHDPGIKPNHDTLVRHTTDGAGIIMSTLRGPWAKLLAETVLMHHENYDGSGYHGVRGNDIPVDAQILRIADYFDAATTTRPDRPALSAQESLQEMAENAHFFNPQMLVAFCAIAPAAYQKICLNPHVPRVA